MIVDFETRLRFNLRDGNPPVIQPCIVFFRSADVMKPVFRSGRLKSHLQFLAGEHNHDQPLTPTGQSSASTRVSEMVSERYRPATVSTRMYLFSSINLTMPASSARSICSILVFAVTAIIGT